MSVAISEFNVGNARATKEFYIFGIGLYSIVLIGCIFDFFWSFARKIFNYNKKREEEKHINQSAKSLEEEKISNEMDQSSWLIEIILKIFVTDFLIIRISWLVLRGYYGYPSNEVTFPLSRMAFVFYFSAFSLVVFFWASIKHKTHYGNESFLPETLAILFFIINASVWIFQIAIIVVSYFQKLNREEGILYNSNIVVDAILSLLVSLGFLVYGSIWAKMRYKADVLDPKRKKEAIKIVVLTILFFLCFMMRAILYLWKFLFKSFLDPDLFLSLAYYCPEIISVSLSVFLVETTKSKKQRNTRIIADFYAGEANEDFESQNSLDE